MRLLIKLAYLVLLLSGVSFIGNSLNAMEKTTDQKNTDIETNPKKLFIKLAYKKHPWKIEELAEFVSIYGNYLDEKGKEEARMHWKNCQTIGDEENKLKRAFENAQKEKEKFDEVDKEIHELEEDRKEIEHRRQVSADLLREKDFMQDMISSSSSNDAVLAAYEEKKQKAANALKKAETNNNLVQNAPSWLKD